MKPVISGASITGECWVGECSVQQEWFELGVMPGAMDYSVQQLCQHNQTLAVRNRVIADWGIAQGNLRAMEKVGDALAKYLGFRVKCDPEDWLVQYKGMKAMQYQRALASLDDRPLRRVDSYIKGFVKAEKLTDPLKDPRLIQYRGPRYNIELGNYLKAFEHDLYHVRGTGVLSRWFPNQRLIVKGMNPVARAAHLSKCWNSLKKPVQLALDCSRFDGHVTEEVLKLEHKVYLKCFKNDALLQKLLMWQRNNKGFTKDGVKYEVRGNRMSGDMNTALGNCVLMVMMLGAALKEMGVPTRDFRLADDGDDCCLMVEEKHSKKVIAGIRQIFARFGQDLKIEKIIRDFDGVELCGCKPIRVGGVRKMILEPGRAIGKSRLMLKYRGRFQQDYVATVGECLLALHAGVPVLQAQALALMRVGKQLKLRPRSWAYKLAHHPEIAQPEFVTPDARFDYFAAFGVCIEDQLFQENWYNTASVFDIIGPH